MIRALTSADEAAAAPALVDDDRAVGACAPIATIARVVERAQHAQVDHLGLDRPRAASVSAAASAFGSVPP